MIKNFEKYLVSALLFGAVLMMSVVSFSSTLLECYVANRTSRKFFISSLFLNKCCTQRFTNPFKLGPIYVLTQCSFFLFQLVITRKLRALKGPQDRTNSKRNVACEFVYAAPLARRSQSPIETFSIGDYSLRFVKDFRIVEQYYALRSVSRYCLLSRCFCASA